MIKKFNEDFVKEIGPGMLDGLTSKLYSNGTFVLREYISNSIDARAKNIFIECKSPTYDTISISDDGRGFSQKVMVEILGFLVGFYSSNEEQKKFPTIGKFGIGLYAGGSICDVIEIKTTMAGSKELLNIKIPFSEWRSMIRVRGAERKKSLFEITRYEWIVSEDDQIENKQGTEIILHRITNEVSNQLKNPLRRSKFISELQRQTPLPFDPNLQIFKSEFSDIDGGLNEIVFTNAKKDLFNIVSTNDEIMENAGLEFSSQYNCVNIYFNDRQLFRYAPRQGKQEPIGEFLPKKEFWVKDESGKEKLVGIGWATIRGPRTKKSTKTGDPIETAGVFSTKEIQGIQVRLYNVEVIPYNQIWSVMGIRTSSQPIDHIWGEINLFNQEIDLSHNRRSFVEDGIFIEIQNQIESWVSEILRSTEVRRRQILAWRRIIRDINSYEETIKEISDLMSKPEQTKSLYNSNTKRIEIFIRKYDKKRKSKLKRDVRIVKIPNLIDTLNDRINGFNKNLGSFREQIKDYNEKYGNIQFKSESKDSVSDSAIEEKKQIQEKVFTTSREIVSDETDEPQATDIAKEEIAPQRDSSIVVETDDISDFAGGDIESSVSTIAFEDKQINDVEIDEYWNEWKDRVKRTHSLKKPALIVIDEMIGLLKEVGYNVDESKNIAERMEGKFLYSVDENEPE